MDEKNTNNDAKRDFIPSLKQRCSDKFNEFKSEFKKIVWPPKSDLVKQTIIVIIVSVMFGVYITLLDSGFALAFQQIVLFFS